MEEKANEIEESEQKIQGIADELNEKKAELESGIEEYNTAIEEISGAEKECDVDLSQSKDAAGSDRDELVEASSKIDGILEKIDSALSNDSAQKKTKFIDAASQGINNVIKGAGDFAKKAAGGTMMFSAILGGAIGTYDKIISPILDINDKLISKVAPNSVFSEVSKPLSDAKEKALGNHVGDYEDLKVIQDKEQKKREEERKIADRVANEPKISR